MRRESISSCVLCAVMVGLNASQRLSMSQPQYKVLKVSRPSRRDSSSNFNSEATVFGVPAILASLHNSLPMLLKIWNTASLKLPDLTRYCIRRRKLTMLLVSSSVSWRLGQCIASLLVQEIAHTRGLCSKWRSLPTRISTRCFIIAPRKDITWLI